MSQDWAIVLLLAFGIAVGIVGVIAYLRLLRKEKRAASSHSAEDAPPSPDISADSDKSSGDRGSNPEQD